jgi:flagellar basal body rod protein FlgC
MNSAFGIARSGLQDAALRISVSAHNRANAETSGFVPGQVVSRAAPNGGVSSRVVAPANPAFDARMDETTLGLSGTNLVDETVASMTAVASFQANLASLQTAAQLDQVLMSIKA